MTSTILITDEAGTSPRDPSHRPAETYAKLVAGRSWRDIALSIAGVALLTYGGWHLASWALFNSVSGTGPEACQGIAGACWSVIQARYRLILFGLYPYDEQWRSAIACAVVILTVGLACAPPFWTALRMSVVWVVGYGLFVFLMHGGLFGLATVPTGQWGGLALTLFIYVTVIAFGFPIAILLALVRRDAYPAFRWLTTLIVDLTRSLPLLTILFSAAVILPLVLPEMLQGDKLVRTLIGFVFFFACYQSEIIRGGLQVVPDGQAEAAKALGLSYFQRVGLVVLPQAFRTAMPATINQFVITFKETSLVVIVGVFDLMASANAAYNTGVWTPYYREVYLFVAAIYFVGAFSLSRYGAYTERRLKLASH